MLDRAGDVAARVAAMKCPRGVQTIAATPGVFSKREDTMAESTPGPALRPPTFIQLLSLVPSRARRGVEAGGVPAGRLPAASVRFTRPATIAGAG